MIKSFVLLSLQFFETSIYLVSLEMYLAPCQKSMTELFFVKTVNGPKPFTIFTKKHIPAYMFGRVLRKLWH